MNGTISGAITITYTLVVSPTTIQDTGTVAVTVGNAIYGSAASAWSVLNAGSITGAVDAISMHGGYLWNAAQGVISGGANGVVFLGSGTVVNAGTLRAGAPDGDALQFFHGYTDRLVIDPGAVFVGAVDGAGIAGVVSGSVLELASGSSIGTLDGLGSKFTNVGSIVVDPGAHWLVSGTATYGVVLKAGAGITLAAGGTMIAGTASAGAVVVAARGGMLRNYGRIDDAQETGVQLRGGTVVNAGGALIAGGKYGLYFYGAAGTVVNGGTIAGGSLSGVMLRAGGLVVNAAQGSITGLVGVFVIAGTAPGTVVNEGSITCTGSSGYGVVLSSGGTITNAASASISGRRGVLVETPGTVVNAGGISGAGTNGLGVLLDAGGYVANAAAGSISGYVAGVALAGAGIVANGGRIAATGTNGYGVGVAAPGTVTNAAGGLITGGGLGVDLPAGGTLVNGGTIIGSGGTAVVLGGTGENLLVLEPGFGFSGLVSGGASAANTLELASAAATGTVTGLGTQFTNFGSIAFAAGAKWMLSGNSSALMGTISGFALGDTIELAGLTETKSSFSHGILTLDNTVGFTTLDLPGDFNIGSFYVTPNGAATEVTVAPCFAAGTHLLTVDGELAVEALAVGDLVVTRSGRLRPVQWIGHRRVASAGHERPHDVCPVRICADAFSPGVPHRALLISPDHAVQWEGALIPIRYLINGATIRQEAPAAVIYYHVELDTHDVVLAEGLPAESYLDTGNRGAFANGGLAVAQRR